MGRLSEFGKRTPAWIHLYNEKYQLRTVKRLNDLLKRAGISQKDLAEKADWSEGYVSRILSGKQNITLKTLARLEAAIGMDALQVTSDVPYPSGMQPIGICKLMSEAGSELEINFRHGGRKYTAQVRKYVSETDKDDDGFVELEGVTE